VTPSNISFLGWWRSRNFRCTLKGKPCCRKFAKCAWCPRNHKNIRYTKDVCDQEGVEEGLTQLPFICITFILYSLFWYLQTTKLNQLVANHFTQKPFTIFPSASWYGWDICIIIRFSLRNCCYVVMKLRINSFGEEILHTSHLIITCNLWAWKPDHST
jgi:hypothetical protein